ncbi:MAG: class I SAM-dependent methyltransferase [Candidatus Helarchaeota archaeon]
MTFRVFNENFEKYDDWYKAHQIFFECEAKVLRELNLQGRGLSIGVGTGILDSQANIEIGIDPALNMLKIAANRKINVILASSEYLPFKQSTFDFILMVVTICFLEAPETSFKELKKVIKSKGILAICIVPKESSWGQTYMEKIKKGHTFYQYAKFYSIPEIDSLLKRHSFKIIETKSTLSYSPDSPPVIEEPSDSPENMGFVCIKSMKI